MYQTYWGLREKPFVNTPDPRFLYMSAEHEEALGRMRYAITQQMGACLLTGIYGCGKTLLIEVLLDDLVQSGNFKIGVISYPQLTHLELLRTVATHLGATDMPKTRNEIMADVIFDAIKRILEENERDGKSTVLIIDEAHVIEDRTIFEELRLLLNLQLRDKFLLTLVLVGQPELRKNIDAIKQFSQRIPLRYHLEPLTKEEVKKYVLFRLKISGSDKKELFTQESFDLIYEKSGGIPRHINHICDISLLLGFGRGAKIIDANIVQEASRDLQL